MLQGLFDVVHKSAAASERHGLRKERISMNLIEIIRNNEVDDRTFGKYVKERREALGMSIRGLASELKVSAAYISDIEKGNRYAPSQGKLDKLIEVLRIPEEYRVAFNDLASATHGFTYEDINPYLGREPHARVALRKAEKMGLSDSFWISVIEQMDQAEAEQLKALEEDSEMPD